MNLSFKEYTEQTGLQLDKQAVMKSCSNNFRTIQTNETIDDVRLNTLGQILQKEIVYSNIVWENNHRKKENAILTDIDFLIFDIDDGLTIEEVHNMFNRYDFKIMTLTTTSHTEEHHKFRVLIPLSQKTTFKDTQEYKEFLKLFNEKYFNNQVDKACLEAGRAYITTSKAQYSISNSGNLFNISSLHKKAKQQTWLRKYNDMHVKKSVNTKIATIDEVKNYSKVKALVSTFSSGNHTLAVYKIIGIGKQAGLSNNECAELIISYNLGKEYNNKQDLIRKANTYNS